MKKAVIYARYSSGSQTEQSIEGQLRVCHKFAQDNDFLVLKEYIDRAKTAQNDNRPRFQEMLADSSKNNGIMSSYTPLTALPETTKTTERIKKYSV